MSTLLVLAGNVMDAPSFVRMSLALIAMWLAVFLGMSLFSRAMQRLALRLLRSFHGRSGSQHPVFSDQALFAQARGNPRVSSDVQALLDADADTASDQPAAFIAPRYCRYL